MARFASKNLPGVLEERVGGEGKEERGTEKV